MSTYKKFTFKKVPRKGGERKSTDIKLSKKVVGYLVELDDRKWKIRLAEHKVPTYEDPATFKWVAIKKKFESEVEAREYLSQRYAVIQDRVRLHRFGD